jgi:hypothetical protein
MFTAFAACFLALLAFTAVQSVADIPGLAFDPSGEVDFSLGALSFVGILLSGFALGYAMRARRSQRRRKIYY